MTTPHGQIQKEGAEKSKAFLMAIGRMAKYFNFDVELLQE